MKLSAGIHSISIEQENDGSSSKDNYLGYTKLEQGKPANFALLEQDPLEYWLVWAEAKAWWLHASHLSFMDKPSDLMRLDLELGSEYVRVDEL